MMNKEEEAKKIEKEFVTLRIKISNLIKNVEETKHPPRQ
jgi:hypothetical protein